MQVEQNLRSNAYGEVQAAGINIGFGWTKLATEGQLIKFQSVAAIHTPQVMGRKPEEHNLVAVGSNVYEVGEGATLTANPLKALHRQFYESEVYQALVKASMQRLSAIHSQWNVMVGIAIDHYKNETTRKAVENLWSGTHHLRNGRTIRINRVQIMAETIGATSLLMEDAARAEIWQNASVYVLDFGRFNSSWINLQRGRATKNSGSIDFGMTNYLASASDIVRKQSRPNITDTEVELWLEGQGKILSKPASDGTRSELSRQDISASAIEATWPEFESQIKSRLGDTRGADICVVGGGAHVFKARLQNCFKDAVLEFPPEAQFLNARGLLAGARAMSV
jgi:Actin like proteins N terminal domain